MPFTTPRTWVSGEYPTAAQLNTHLRDNVSFLGNPPACRVWNSTNFDVAYNTAVTVTFDSERFDTDTMHSTSTNTGRITFNTAGLYVVGVNGIYSTFNDYTIMELTIRLNGTTNIGGAGMDTWNYTSDFPRLSPTTVYKFAVADYVEVRAFQRNGASALRQVGAVPNESPEFWACWIGTG